MWFHSIMWCALFISQKYEINNDVPNVSDDEEYFLVDQVDSSHEVKDFVLINACS